MAYNLIFKFKEGTMIFQSSYRWLTSQSIWNAPNEVEKTQKKLEGKNLSFVEKMKMGAKTGLSSIPRSVVISLIATVIISQIYPPLNFQEMKECIDKNKSLLSQEGDLIFTNIQLKSLPRPLKTAIKAIWEEIIFRGGIQNLLGKLENSESKILSSLGSLKGRVTISSLAFAAIHLNNFNAPCQGALTGLTQLAVNILLSDMTILYETGGLTATMTGHVVRNLTPWAVSSIIQTIFASSSIG